MNQYNFFIKIFCLLAAFALYSCWSDNIQNQSNEEFEKKFSSEVSKINAARASMKSSFQGNESGSAVAANSKPEEANNLPEDMFSLIYGQTIDSPFLISGMEFDTITIPDHDRYGVASTLNDKRYFLAGNQILQKNIDEMTKQQSAEDIEFSEALIKEQKKLRRQQKLEKIFGDDPVFINKNKGKNKDTAKKEEQPSIIDENLRKQIALQIIRQNIANNSQTQGSQDAQHKKQQNEKTN